VVLRGRGRLHLEKLVDLGFREPLGDSPQLRQIDGSPVATVTASDGTRRRTARTTLW
jgi:hypothetical protein